MLRITWRLQRTGLIGMGAFGVFYGLLQAAAYNAIAGQTAAARRAFGQQMETFGRQYSLVLPLALLALTLTIYAISATTAQLAVSRSAAAGLAGLVVGVTFFVNGLSRSVDGLELLARAISPFYYYDRSQPLSPGGTFDVAATLALFVAASLLTVLAVWFMSWRDLGAPLIQLPARPRPFTRRPSSNPLPPLP